MFANLKRDVLIFADHSRVAAGVITGDPKAIVLSSGMLNLLEKLYLGERTTTPAVEDFASAVPLPAAVRRRGYNAQDQLPKVVSELAQETGVFSLDADADLMGPINSSVNVTDGQVSINGTQVWTPAGQQRTRRIGSHNLISVIAEMDLAGHVKKDLRISASIASRDKAPVLVADDPSCGGCGACGVCALCGGANASAAAAAAVAILAIYLI